ncbi:patellin-3 [Ziziphus jujuba]|uniref:Patellin-3 n=1 Tax=Ziziphus jujuba TaxID=326968 RepID=A0A6P4BTP4_ZIZJJ|nr:patellin-3 [Ziziphus jujuba]
MAEDPHKPAAAEATPSGEVGVVADVPPAEKAVSVNDPPAPVPEPEPEAAEKSEEKPQAVVAAASEEVVVVEEEKPKAVEEQKTITQSVSFKEESYVVTELPDPQKKALDELKQLIQQALNKHEFTTPPPPPPAPKEDIKSEETPAEEKKKDEEEKTEKVEEAPKAESPATETEPPKTETEPVKEPAPEPKEEKAPAPAPAPAPSPAPESSSTETVVVAEVVEKITATDEDGAKTVEAIKESIVEVSASAVSEEPAPKETEKAPATEEAASTAAAADAPAETKEEVPAPPPPPPEEVFIWGIPLLADERSDVILLKFLRARDFKVKDAFAMIKNTVRWRKEFGIDALLDEDLGSDWDKVVFTHGVDKKGHPVCYNVFGEFSNKELYQNTFGDEEKRSKFIKWRIQFLEKSIRKFNFDPTGISTIVQVNDLRNSPGLFKREHHHVTNQALQLLQDNYPEFVARQVFVNVPWWYLAFNRFISPFLTQRTKSKFVFAGPSKSAETLFKYIAPEQVPVQYGGLSREGEQEFTTSDPVTEFTVKPASKHIIEIPVSESGVLVWEIRVVGWDVSYGAEFVPSAEDQYTIIIQKTRKITPADEPVITNSYKIGDPGKVVLTIDNQSSKKKKILYRTKTKTSSE